MDIQLIKSTITRQILDNLYLTNNARTGVVEGQVNLDDMLSVAPGGVIRMKNPNAIVPINVAPVANQAFPMLEYLDGIQSKRTGISDMQQGLNPDILQNVTAAAIAATQSASSGKIELIARIFAETGVKSLFQGILHLVTKYQDKPRMIRLRGKYVPIDPRTWSNQYDLSISVGLGTGNKQEQMAMLQMVRLNKSRSFSSMDQLTQWFLSVSTAQQWVSLSRQQGLRMCPSSSRRLLLRWISSYLTHHHKRNHKTQQFKQ